MKKITLLFLILFAFPGLNQARAQNKIDKNSVTGSWLGKLEVSGISLRIVFNLSVIEKDSLVATMDSPDQGAKDIKLGPVNIDNENIKISAPMLLGEYIGTIKNDTLIEGTWTQRGNTLPLNLTKLRKAFTLNRPQEPKPPFPYIMEDVKFTNEKAGINLAGTLTIPQGEGPFPAVILITGSGSQNRNEELLGHKPFWVIADYMSRNGIAVLRYDDRGVGQSQGTPLKSTAADFATDAGAAFRYLRTRKEIDQESVGIAGHSEGGLVASLVASDNHEIAFIISLGGQGVTGEKISLRQNKDIGVASGVDETEIKKANAINKKLYAVLKKESDDKKAEEKMTANYKKLLIKKKANARGDRASLEPA